MNGITSHGARGASAHITLKGRQVEHALLIFVSQILAIEQAYLLLHASDSFTIRDIFHPKIWRKLNRAERQSAGLCLSWLVDHGHVPLVKLRARRGNTLLYRLNTIQ